MSGLLLDTVRRLFFWVPSLPAVAQIEVTNKCNFSCAMCQRLALKVPIEHMSLDTFTAVVDKLDAVPDLILTGWGEPFVHPEIFIMIRYAKRKGHRVRLTSNGDLLDAERRAQLLASGLDTITFSIDDLEPPPDTIAHPIRCQLENLEALLRERGNRNTPQVILQATLHKNREQKIYDIIAYAARIGADKVNVGRLDTRFDPTLQRPTLAEERRFVREIDRLGEVHNIEVDFVPHLAFSGLARTAYKVFHSMLHRFGRYCLRTYNNVYINVHGQVTPCCALPRLALGELMESDIQTIWQSERFWRFRKEQDRVCGRCDVLHLRYKI